MADQHPTTEAWPEPTIRINGTILTKAQAMTIRVALGSFALGLESNGLGTDETGKRIAEGYLAAIDSIHVLMRVS